MPCKHLSVLGEGWDFVNFLADDTWVVRIPKRADADRALVHERKILDRLTSLNLPASVPRFEHFSGPREHFPWHFAAYRVVRGTPLSLVDDEAVRASVAIAIGEFLAVLHQAVIGTEVASPWNPGDQRTWATREFRLAESAYPDDIRRRVERYLERPPVPMPNVPQVLVHADLLGEHILVDVGAGGLSGVIDWADAFTTLRSVDFAGLFFEGGRGLAAKAYSAYGVTPDEHEWRWLEQTAVAIAIGHVFYGYRSNQRQLMEKGLARIRDCLRFL
jgi:aminoglycoside phosphotransferase (APT) family kinase protein